MIDKIFTSQNCNFSLTFPEDWDEYDDGSDDTYAFFNSKSWTGNFRITPLYFTNATHSEEDKAAKYISWKVAEGNCRMIRIGEFDCAFIKEVIQEDDSDQNIYYWYLGKKDIILICSFTINQDLEFINKSTDEINIVESIIKSTTIY